MCLWDLPPDLTSRFSDALRRAGISLIGKMFCLKKFAPKLQNIQFYSSVMTPIPDSEIPKDLSDKWAKLLEAFKRALLEQQPRDDYRELVELSVLVLDGSLSTERRIRRPGAMHQARWMVKPSIA